MTRLRTAFAGLTLALASLSPAAAQAYSISDLAGVWSCAARQDDGSITIEYTYIIRPDSTALIEGGMTARSDGSLIFIQYDIEHDIMVSEDTFTQSVRDVRIRKFEQNGNPLSPQERENLQKDMMLSPTESLPIRYLNSTEFYYAEAGFVSACAKEY